MSVFLNQNVSQSQSISVANSHKSSSQSSSGGAYIRRRNANISMISSNDQSKNSFGGDRDILYDIFDKIDEQPLGVIFRKLFNKDPLTLKVVPA